MYLLGILVLPVSLRLLAFVTTLQRLRTAYDSLVTSQRCMVQRGMFQLRITSCRDNHNIDATFLALPGLDWSLWYDSLFGRYPSQMEEHGITASKSYRGILVPEK